MKTSGFALDETLVYRIIVDLTWTEPGKTSGTDMQDGEAGAGHATDIDPEGLMSKMDEGNAAILAQEVAHTNKDMGVVGEASPGEAKRGRGRPPKKNGVAKSIEKSSVDGVKRGRGRPPKAKADDGSKAPEEGGAKTTMTGTPGRGRGRGRPLKAKVDKASTSEADKSAEDDEEAVDADDSPSKPKRGRGRPPRAKGEFDETSKKAKVGGKDGEASDSSAGNNTDPAKPKRGRGRPPKAKGDEPEKAGKEKEDEAGEGETDAVKGGAAAPEKKRGRGRPPKTKMAMA